MNLPCSGKARGAKSIYFNRAFIYSILLEVLLELTPSFLIEFYLVFVESPGSTTKSIINLRNIKPEVVIVIGCIIKGDTQHYEFLSSTVINALRNISLEANIPIVNGIITTETAQQAIDRAGTKLNKGKDFAETAVNIRKYYQNLKDNE